MTTASIERRVRPNARLTTALAASLALAVAAGVSNQAAAADDAHLLVADPGAAALHAVALDDGTVVDTLEGVAVADHPGFLPLPDGLVLFTTAEPAELLAVRASDSGLEITGRAELPAATVHLSVNPSITHAAVSVGDWDSETESMVDTAIAVVDLADFSVATMPIETGEPGVILTDEAVVHRNNDPAQFETYPYPDGSGEAIEMVDSAAIGAAGHGEGYDAATGQAFVATDDGLDIVTVDGTDLEFVTTLDWDTADRSGGRAYYLRRAPGAGALVSYVTDRSADTWGEWTTDAVIFDPVAASTLRVPLGNGLVYRLGIGDGSALFFTQVPQEDATGDQAHILDIDPSSATYGEVVSSIPLPALSAQGTSDASIWEAGELRIAAVTPDGATGFVTSGGDGLISVIDTASGEIVDTIEVPTALEGGGYLTVASTASELGDNIGK